VAEQVVVQKWVVVSPRIEHSVALMFPEQSESTWQNFPMPFSLPVSPGWPHVEKNASTAFASGCDGELLPHPTIARTSRHILMAELVSRR
jgi:hypothetical protein